ncbi:MAG: hypothetical protein QNJ97_17420 [Myxococcota bacterium]|nr:hypothetical protein [Myxococcota bacterium]
MDRAYAKYIDMGLYHLTQAPATVGDLYFQSADGLVRGKPGNMGGIAH